MEFFMVQLALLLHRQRLASGIDILQRLQERREDFDQFWCALAGLDGDAVRERLSEQSPHREEAA